jgi:hypothetical protein
MLEIKLLMIRFIVLLTSCLIPRMSSISALTELINLVNMKTFGLLCYTFHMELIVLLRVFDALCYLDLFLCRTIYSN